jgi:hypothetical protein
MLSSVPLDGEACSEVAEDVLVSEEAAKRLEECARWMDGLLMTGWNL